MYDPLPDILIRFRFDERNEAGGH